MKRSRLLVALLSACCLAWTVSLSAEEAPLAVGSEGVPVPKKVKDLKPRYPPEAIAQGIRGIVILDLVIDTTGAVESVNVVRSVAGLDDAAVAAASQWRYEPVKVAGRPTPPPARPCPTRCAVHRASIRIPPPAFARPRAKPATGGIHSRAR